MENIKAVLSTTVLPLDGIYNITTLSEERKVDYISSFSGVLCYIFHPSTQEIVLALGAKIAESKLFPGLQPGELAIAVSIKQGRSSRVVEGKTVDQIVTVEDLDFRVIYRIE